MKIYKRLLTMLMISLMVINIFGSNVFAEETDPVEGDVPEQVEENGDPETGTGNTVHVTLHANGGTFDNGTDLMEVDLEKGSTLSEAEANGLIDLSPEKDRYYFNYWVDSDNMIHEVQTALNEDVTLYANWSLFYTEYDNGLYVYTDNQDWISLATRDSFTKGYYGIWMYGDPYEELPFYSNTTAFNIIEKRENGLYISEKNLINSGMRNADYSVVRLVLGEGNLPWYPRVIDVFLSEEEVISIENGAKDVPFDVSVDQDENDDLIISSNDKDYLRALTDESVLGDDNRITTMGARIYATDPSISSSDAFNNSLSNGIFVNTDANTMIVYDEDEGVAKISRETMANAGLFTGPATFYIYSSGYLMTVQNTDLVLSEPEVFHIEVTQDPETEDLLLTTDGPIFEGVADLYDISTNEIIYPSISCSLVSEGHYRISADVLKQSQVKNGEYYLGASLLTGSEEQYFARSKTFQIQLTEENTVHVTLHSNGGKIYVLNEDWNYDKVDIYETDIAKGSSLSAIDYSILHYARRKDHMLRGWSDSEQGGTLIDEDEAVLTEDIDLYAQWDLLSVKYVDGEGLYVYSDNEEWLNTAIKESTRHLEYGVNTLCSFYCNTASMNILKKGNGYLFVSEKNVRNSNTTAENCNYIELLLGQGNTVYKALSEDEVFPIPETACSKELPFDVTAKQDQNGDLIISSSDKEYLRSLTDQSVVGGDGRFTTLGGRIYILDSSAASGDAITRKYDTKGVFCNAANKKIIYDEKEGVAKISLQTLRDNGIVSGTYTVHIYSSGYVKTSSKGVVLEIPVIKTGWNKIGDYYYYFDSNGKMLTGFQKIGTGTYYLDPSDGHMLTGWQKIDGKYYYFKPGSSGRMLTGFQKIGTGTYYLDPSDGHMLTGWQKIDGKYYYFKPGSSGRMLTGFQKIGTGTYYLDPSDGHMLTGWQKIDGKYYYFKPGSSGRMLTGFQKIGTGTYYLDPSDGHMLTGWQKIDGKYYYFKPGSSGRMLTGFQKIGTGTYYLDPSDGHMLTGWQKIDGKYYYFKPGSSGRMLTGFQKIGTGTYYLDPSDGHMLTGWQTIGGYRYYFKTGSSGRMLTGWQQIDGKYYYFDPETGRYDSSKKR